MANTAMTVSSISWPTSSPAIDGIYPKSVIQYDRMAFINHPFDAFCRVTIDTSISYRRDNFNLNEIGGGLLLLCR
jgi:hypothetical protein